MREDRSSTSMRLRKRRKEGEDRKVSKEKDSVENRELVRFKL